MSDQLQERVNEILHETDVQTGSMLAANEEASETTLAQTAAEASDLLDSTEPRDLLDAVGLGTLPDGTEPETLPEAITQGDPEHVEDLERLLRLAKLDDEADEETLDDAMGELRAAIDERQASEDEDSSEREDGDEDEATTEPADADGDEATDEDAAEGEETDDGVVETVEEQFRSTMGEQLTEFTDDVEGLQERLAEVGASSIGGDDAADAGDGGDADGTDSGDADEESEPDGEDEDELVSTELGSDLDLGSDDEQTMSRGVARHSTMGPPPSERADMKVPARFSTMPETDRE